MSEKKPWDLDECSSRVYRLDAIIGTVRRVLEEYEDDEAIVQAAYVLREASKLARKWANRMQCDSFPKSKPEPVET